MPVEDRRRDTHDVILKCEGRHSVTVGFDLIDPHGQKWEVRSITGGGIYFCPSYMVGSGRSFNEPGFLAKLDDLAGYIVADVATFPDVPFWIITSAVVRAWWNDGRLGTSSKISRSRALELLRAQA